MRDRLSMINSAFFYLTMALAITVNISRNSTTRI